MSSPPWLVDEMLGRLARYLRFVGCDVLYVTGLSDDQVLDLARQERRTILTRDRELARRSPGAVLLRRHAIGDQWRELRAAVPDLPAEVRFDRCTECNGRLVPYTPGVDPASERTLPPPPARPPAVFACASCGHLYWEGSHTRRIRDQIARWGSNAPP